jgi:hypothetical protein
VYHRFDVADLEHVRSNAEVPLWLPEPRPQGWKLAGLAAVGDGRSRIRATVTAWAGPAPLGGDGEWLLIAEEPGIGLGASYAGTDELALTDGGPAGHGQPSSKIHAVGRPTPLWSVPSVNSDRSAYVGEAAGVWLWLVSYPADAGYAVLEDFELTDIRIGAIPELPTTTHSTRLRPGAPGEDAGPLDRGE